MNKTLMIALGALALAACAPMNTSSNSMSSGMAMSGASTSGTSSASDAMTDNMTGTGTTSAAASTTAPVVNTATPTTTNVTGTTSGKYTLSRQPTAPAGVNPVGDLSLNVQGDGSGNGSIDTVATLSGLAPNTYYVAHYHVQGTASANPCASKGAPIMASAIVARSSDTGTLTLRKTEDQNAVRSATYFNVHTAKDVSGAPADDGVACTSIH